MRRAWSDLMKAGPMLIWWPSIFVAARGDGEG